MSPKTLKKLHTYECCAKAISAFMLILAAIALIVVIFIGNDEKILQTIAIKAVGFVALLLFARVSFFFEALAKEYRQAFVKVLKRRDTNAVFRERMANL